MGKMMPENLPFLGHQGIPTRRADASTLCAALYVTDIPNTAIFETERNPVRTFVFFSIWG